MLNKIKPLEFFVWSISLASAIFIFASYWNWFVSPLGVTKIGYAQAFGMAIMLRLFTKDIKLNKKDQSIEEKIGWIAANWFVFFVMMLVSNYV